MSFFALKGREFFSVYGILDTVIVCQPLISLKLRGIDNSNSGQAFYRFVSLFPFEDRIFSCLFAYQLRY